MHPDAGASGRHHRGHLLQRKPRHVLKEHSQFRMLVDQVQIHIREFTRTRNKHGQHPLLLMLLIFPVVLHQPGVGDPVKNAGKLFIRQPGRSLQLGKCLRLADLFEVINHKLSDLLIVITQDADGPVFRVILCHLFQPKLDRDPICDQLSKGGDRFLHRAADVCTFRPQRIFRIFSCHEMLSPFLSLPMPGFSFCPRHSFRSWQPAAQAIRSRPRSLLRSLRRSGRPWPWGFSLQCSSCTFPDQNQNTAAHPSC